MNSENSDRYDLACPLKKEMKQKVGGAWYDERSKIKAWYIPTGVDATKFAKWPGRTFESVFMCLGSVLTSILQATVESDRIQLGIFTNSHWSINGRGVLFCGGPLAEAERLAACADHDLYKYSWGLGGANTCVNSLSVE